MSQINILNSKEIKKINEFLTENFNYALREDYAYLKTEKEKIFLVNKDIAKLNLKNLIIDRIGLYFAEEKNGYVRLSKEGAQLFFKEATANNCSLKNVIELNREEVEQYFLGQDLPKDLGDKSIFVLLKYKDEVFGCAKYKEQKIINFLSKIYRGTVIL